MKTYLSDNSYLAIIPETTAGNALVPTNFVPLVSESIKTVVNHKPDKRMSGIDWNSKDMLRGDRTHEGDVVVLADPDTLGYFLDMTMTAGTPTGDSTVGYTHEFTVGTPKSYTFEIKKGEYAQRYFGVHIDKLKLAISDGQLEITASIKAMGQCGVFSAGAISTAVTTLQLSDNYDIAPTRGIVAGDILVVGGTDYTVSAVTSDTVVTLATTITVAVGDSVVLKPQTASIASLQDPFYIGNLLAGFGATASDATTAAGSRATATPLYDLSIEINNNVFDKTGSGRLDPVQIFAGSREASVTLKQLFTDSAQRQAWLGREKQAMVLSFLGKYIAADNSTQEQFVLTLNNVKLVTDTNEVKVGDFIMDDEDFAVLYDSTDGVAMSATLINRTASY